MNNNVLNLARHESDGMPFLSALISVNLRLISFFLITNSILRSVRSVSSVVKALEIITHNTKLTTLYIYTLNPKR